MKQCKPSVTKAFVLFSFLLFASVGYGATAIKYVTQKGAGLKDGSSWTNAYDSTGLQTAINTLATNGGGQVWVAKGNYYPTEDETGNKNPTDPRMKTFSLKKGVAVYGGFKGTETSIPINGPDKSTLCGDLGVKWNGSDNSYNVVYCNAKDTSAILSSFFITYGRALGTTAGRSQQGGGAHLNGGLIMNCQFNADTALYGGAVYMKGNSKVTKSIISWIQAIETGGGIYAAGGGIIDACTITGCWAKNGGNGGGIYALDSTTITNCTISSCSSYTKGGGLYASGKTTVVRACTFRENRGYGYGAAAYCENGCVVSQSTFVGNILNSYCRGSLFLDNALVENSRFYMNSGAVYDGAAIFAQNNSTIMQCLVYNNEVGVQIKGSGPRIINCVIANNGSVNSEYQDLRIYSIVPGQCSVINSFVGGCRGTTSYHSGTSTNVPVGYTIVKDNSFEASYSEGIKMAFVNPTLYSGLYYSYGSTVYSEATLAAADWSLDNSSTNLFINTGTTDTVGLGIPKTDFAGNPRVKYGRIDIGAYEYSSTRYVTQSGAGSTNGTSWANAYPSTSLQAAINKGFGEVFVASGLYSSTNAFQLSSIVKVYGGFKGTETDTAQRERKDADGNGIVERWEFANPSILDGKMTNDTIVSLTMTNTSYASLLDGFTIQSSYSALSTTSSYAVYLNSQMSDKISNCIIKDNVNNSVGGGTIGLSGNAQVSSCLITGNTANSGAGVRCIKGGLVENSVIKSNTAKSFTNLGVFYPGNGGGVYSVLGGTIKNSTISDNTAINGAGAYSNQDITIEKCKIVNNNASESGGGLVLMYGGTVNKSDFSSNTASEGGAVSIENTGSIEACKIQNNSATVSSGAIDIALSGTVRNSLIVNNSASSVGGVKTGSGFCALTNNTIANNADKNIATVNYASQTHIINTVSAGLNTISTSAKVFNSAFTDSKRGTKSVLLSSISDAGFVSPTSFIGSASTANQLAEITAANWSLTDKTSLINAGNDSVELVKQPGFNDVAGNYRVALNKIDIGAYELQSAVAATAVSAITVQQTKPEAIKLSWVKSKDAAGYLVFMKQASAGYALPTKGTSYSADTVFGKSLANVGDGWFAVYSGTDSTVQVSNLVPGAWYRVQVSAYRCSAYKMYSATEEGKNIISVFAKQPQTITFDAPASVVGKNEITLAAYSTSGLPISYTVPTGAKATIVDNRLVVSQLPTTITVTANQAGDANRYYAATAVSKTIAFTKATQTITFDALDNKTFGDADFVLAATSTSGQPIVYTSSKPSVASVVNNIVHINAGGTAFITASQPASELFDAAVSKTVKLFVGPKSQSIAFDTIYPQTAEAARITLVATAESGKNITFEVSPDSVAKLVNDKIQIDGVGTATVTATQVGDSSYKAATATRVLKVEKGSQTISFLPLPVKTYGAAAFDIEASSSSQLPVALSCSNTAIAAISGTTVSIKKAGTVQITASQEGNKNFAAASSVSRSLTILPASQTITFDSLAVYPYSANLKITSKVSLSSGRKARLTSYDLSVAKIVNDTTILVVGAGKTIITASHDGDSCYAQAAPVQRELVVTKMKQSIKFAKTTSAVYGQSDIVLNDTASSKLKTTVSSSDITVVSIVNGKLHIVGVGTANITISQAGSSIFESVDSSFTISVIKKKQDISFAPIANRSIADGDVFPVVKASSGLFVTLKSNDEKVARIENGIIKILAADTVKITASQSGNENYEAAKDSTLEFIIRKATQSIIFSTLPTLTYSKNQTLSLDGFATSKLPITYTSSNPKIASVKGNIVTIHTAGSTIITASQAGNDSSYEAAADKQQVLTILKMSQEIKPDTAFVDTVMFDKQLLTVRDSSTRGLKLEYQSSNESVAVITKEGKVQIVGAGTTIISAHQNGDSIVDAARSVEHRLVVLEKIQSISVSSNAQVVYGSKDFELITSDKQSTVRLQSQTPNVVQVVNGKINTVGVGTAYIRITQDAIAGYKPIDTTVSITITKAKDSVYFKPLANKLFGQQSFRLFAYSKSGQAVTYSSTNSAVASVIENEVTINAAGTCQIKASVAESDNYKADSTAQSFTVSAMDVLKMPSYQFARDTAIDLNALRLNTDDFKYTFVSAKNNTVTIVGSQATIVPNRSKACWTGVDTLWFKAVNNKTKSDSVTFAVKVTRTRYADQIGMVSTDSVTGTYNVIAWEPKHKAATGKWIVYRRSQSLSQWDAVDSVSATDLSVIVDKKINTQQQAYQYVLVTKDSLGCASPQSAPHTTMHLKTGVSLQNYPQLWWTPYEGIAVDAYIIYRQNPQTKVYDSIGSTFLTSFTDLKPNGTTNYRVAIKFASWVKPSKLKTDSGPFSQSFSNMSEASLVDVAVIDTAVEISAWPNPATEVLNVKLADNNGATISLFAANGSLVAQTTIANGAAQFDVTRLASGLYSLQVQTDKKAISQSVTISK